MTRRRAIALAAAVLLFGGGSALVVALLDGGAVRDRPGATAAAPPAGPSGAEAPSAGPAPAAVAPAGPPSDVPPPAGPPGPVPWESVLAVHRPSELGRELAAPVSDALDEASNRMEYCYEAERRRMANAKPPAPGQAIAGPAILVLRLEGAPGRLVVVGTEIETIGHSSRAFAECCEAAMRGYELTAPAAKPGQRIRYKMLLQ